MSSNTPQFDVDFMQQIALLEKQMSLAEFARAAAVTLRNIDGIQSEMLFVRRIDPDGKIVNSVRSWDGWQVSVTGPQALRIHLLSDGAIAMESVNSLDQALQDAEGRCVSDEIQTADIADEAVCAKFAETIAMLLDNNDALSDELRSMLHKLVN